MGSPKIEIDFNAVLKDLDGEPYDEPDAQGNKVPITLGKLSCAALTANVPGDKADQGVVFKRCRLAERLNGKPLDEDEEDDSPKFKVLSLNLTQRKVISERIFAFARMPRTVQGYPLAEGMMLFYRCNEILEIKSDLDDDEEEDE